MEIAKKVPISVLIPTRNEEANIAKCLDSIEWADEIFVVDSNSEDRTIEISQRYTENVINFTWNGQYPRKKNWALDNLPFSHEWVLIVDADEEVTPELEQEIARIVEGESEYDAYMIRYNYYFLRKLLKHGDPLWKCVLFKHQHTHFERMNTPDVTGYDVEVHEHPVIHGRLGYLNGRMIHRDFEDIHHYFDRHNVYSDWEVAIQSYRMIERKNKELKPGLVGSHIQRRRFFKELFFRIPFKPVLFFIYAYFFRLGFLDGKAGFIYNALKAIYWFEVNVKLYEHKLQQRDTRSSPKN